MPIRLQCPDCRHPLAVPSKFRGQQVDCPKCRAKFTVDATGDEESGTYDALQPEGPIANGSRSGELPSLHLADGPRPVPVRPVPVAVSSRKVQFIAQETAETPLKPDKEGRLPELALSDSELHREDLAEEKESNPAVLVSVLAVSFMLSLLLLFADFEGGESVNMGADEARDRIAQEYFHNESPQALLADYQLYLRRAQRAHARGDLNEERQWYRRVLNLLHAETAKSYHTVTGTRDRDERLRDLLSRILQDTSE